MDAKVTQTTDEAQQATGQVEQVPAEEATKNNQASSQNVEVTTDNLSDEARLAAEALAATEEEPAGDTPAIAGMKKEEQRLLGSITAMRHMKRALERKFAEKLAIEESSKPPEKSPLEKYVEDNPEAEFAPPFIYLADQKWHKEQDARARKKSEEDTVVSRANDFYLQARAKFTDFDDIVTSSEDLLTEGDQIDIRNAVTRGEDGAEKLYKICVYKTLLAGGDRAKELRAKLQKKVVTKTKASVQNQPKIPGGPSENKNENLPPATPPASFQDVKNNPTLAHIYAAFGV